MTLTLEATLKVCHVKYLPQSDHALTEKRIVMRPPKLLQRITVDSGRSTHRFIFGSQEVSGFKSVKINVGIEEGRHSGALA